MMVGMSLVKADVVKGPWLVLVAMGVSGSGICLVLSADLV